MKINKVNAERFRIARQTCGFTVPQAAKFLQVTERTLHNWESGTCRVPYAAYRLMRIIAGGNLGRIWPGWDGWSLRPGRLISPEGREFKAGEMGWVSLLSQRAHFYAAQYRALKLQAAAVANRAPPPALGLADAASALRLPQDQSKVTGRAASSQGEALASAGRYAGQTWYQVGIRFGGFSPVTPGEKGQAQQNGPSSNTGQKFGGVFVGDVP